MFRSMAASGWLALAALLVATAMADGARAQDQVSFAGYGGEPQKVQAKAFFEPANKALGVTVLQDSHGGYAKIKAQVLSGSPSFDLVALGCAEGARAAKEGLLEPLDYSLIPNARDIDPRLRSEHTVGEWTFSTVLAWNTKTVKTPPKTWAEFWDVKKFPGKRALGSNARQMLEIALLADGVAPEKLYPLDVERAFKKLEEIKPHLALWWSSGAQSVQLLTDGEIDMEAIWNGRAQAAIDAGAAAAYTYNEGIYDVECFMVLKGSKNKVNAMKIINIMLEAKNQATAASLIDYGPVNPKAYDTGIIPADRLKRLPSAPDNLKQQALLDASWYASADADKAFARWTTLLQK
ncbi:MAG TPA: ABC transporter substrate-binding protein [Hyphomicrobiaceae bacterium]|jgi:putative spermidine/putrescine transport system substrate-binding protein|nr:ABC transporter substrate-binding protein [Hyphomicrobiaceae bacterium]